MIKYMNPDQKRQFSLSLYKAIYKDSETLKFTDQTFIKDKVRSHFEDGKSMEPGSLDQLQAIERAVYFHRTKMGGLLW